MGEGRLRTGGPQRTGRTPARPDESQSLPPGVRAAAIGMAALVAGVILWGGYGRRWSWTGINGSTATLWDWLHLLLLPLLLPTVIVPALRPRLEAGMITVDAGHRDEPAAGGEPELKAPAEPQVATGTLKAE